MRLKDLFEASGSHEEDAAIELMSDTDAVDVTVDFDFEVSEEEREDGFIRIPAGAYITSTTIKPFTFMDKQYDGEIPSELLQYITFPYEFVNSYPTKYKEMVDAIDAGEMLSGADAADLVDAYLEYYFKKYVVRKAIDGVSYGARRR